MKTMRLMTVAIMALATLVPARAAEAQVRQTRLGDRMEPFTLDDLDGAPFTYEPGSGRVSVVTFLAAHQKRSDRALDDLSALTAGLRQAGHRIDLVLVVSEGDADHFRRRREGKDADLAVVIDADDALWSRMGVLVTPTTFLVDQQGVIAWIRAGRSFDFAVEAQTALHAALHLTTPPPEDQGASRRPATDQSEQARAARHLRVGRILAEKGDVGAAIDEITKARALTPRVFEIDLELGMLLCRADRAEEALAVTNDLRPTKPRERARAKMLIGWAHRLLGHLDEAATHLIDAIALDPASVRAHYELGQVHEERGDCEEAMASYRRALVIRFDEAP